MVCRLSRCSTWAQFLYEWAYLPLGLWDLSSLAGDQTLIPCIGRWILNPWTAREVPVVWCFKVSGKRERKEGRKGRKEKRKRGEGKGRGKVSVYL